MTTNEQYEAADEILAAFAADDTAALGAFGRRFYQEFGSKPRNYGATDVLALIERTGITLSRLHKIAS